MQLAAQPGVRQLASPTSEFKRTGVSRARAESRSIILEAARNVLATASFKSFSMEQVAQHAGVTRRTVYNLFVSKDDLYRASRSGLIHELSVGVVDHIPPNMPIVDAIRYFLQGVYDLLGDVRNFELISSIERDGAELTWLPADYRRYIRMPIIRTCENYILTRMWRREVGPRRALMISEQLVALVDALVAGRHPHRVHALTVGSTSLELDLVASAYASMVGMPSVHSET